MDYRHDIRFIIARLINRLLFLRPFPKSIAIQFALNKRLLPRPAGVAIVPTKDNILLKLDIHADMGTQLQGSIDRNLYYLGTYEIVTTEIIRRFLKDDGVFIDVGSHNGSMAIFAAKIAKRGKVVAFEPVSALQQRLQENIELNQAKNVRPIQVALGGKAGKLTINVNHRNRGSSSLQKNNSEVYEEQEEVVVDTLDNQIEKHGLGRVDMIKIDVEGFEMAVLEGAKNTLQTHSPYLIIEHDPTNAGAREPFEYITSLGWYSIHIPENGRHIKGSLVEVHSYQDLPQKGITNFVCLPNKA